MVRVHSELICSPVSSPVELIVLPSFHILLHIIYLLMFNITWEGGMGVIIIIIYRVI